MIIQCYRGKLEEGVESPLFVAGMNPRYAKLQSFEVILPVLTIPAKIMQVLEVSSSTIKAQSQLDKLLAKDKYLEENIKKQKLLMEQSQELVTTHIFNVAKFDDEIKKMQKVVKSEKEPNTAMSMASYKLKEEQLVRAKEEKLEAQDFLKQVEKKARDASKAYNQAHKDQNENEKLKKEQVAILEQEKKGNLGATKNWLDIFEYSEDGNVLGIQSYTYKEYNALTREYLPCGHFNLGLKNNIITLINPYAEDLVTQKGDILQFTLIIGS